MSADAVGDVFLPNFMRALAASTEGGAHGGSAALAPAPVAHQYPLSYLLCPSGTHHSRAAALLAARALWDGVWGTRPITDHLATVESAAFMRSFGPLALADEDVVDIVAGWIMNWHTALLPQIPASPTRFRLLKSAQWAYDESDTWTSLPDDYDPDTELVCVAWTNAYRGHYVAVRVSARKENTFEVTIVDSMKNAAQEEYDRLFLRIEKGLKKRFKEDPPTIHRIQQPPMRYQDSNDCAFCALSQLAAWLSPHPLPAEWPGRITRFLVQCYFVPRLKTLMRLAASS